MANSNLSGVRNHGKPLGNRLTMVLPFPPSVNNLYFNVPGKGRVMSKEGKAFKWACHEEMQMQRVSYRTAPPPPYENHLWILVPDRLVRDLSNYVKAVEDAVSTYLHYNDTLNHVWHLYKALDTENPRAVLVLTHKDKPVPRPGVIE